MQKSNAPIYRVKNVQKTAFLPAIMQKRRRKRVKKLLFYIVIT